MTPIDWHIRRQVIDAWNRGESSGYISKSIGISEGSVGGIVRRARNLGLIADREKASKSLKKPGTKWANCKGCQKEIDARSITGLCRKCFDKQVAAANPKVVKRCRSCGTRVDRKNETGLCVCCYRDQLKAEKAADLAMRGVCDDCKGPRVRNAKSGLCRACLDARPRQSVVFAEPEPPQMILAKTCPIGRYGFDWPRLHGMSERGIERLMIAAMDKAGINHA